MNVIMVLLSISHKSVIIFIVFPWKLTRHVTHSSRGGTVLFIILRVVFLLLLLFVFLLFLYRAELSRWYVVAARVVVQQARSGMPGQRRIEKRS